MYNWSVDEKSFKKRDPEAYRLWRLTQLINYGLDGEKLDEQEVKKAWPKIKDNIDRYKRRMLEFLMFNKIKKLSSNSPIIETPSQTEMRNRCPLCLAQSKGYET